MKMQSYVDRQRTQVAVSDIFATMPDSKEDAESDFRPRPQFAMSSSNLKAIFLLSLLIAPTPIAAREKPKPWQLTQRIVGDHLDCILNRREREIRSWLALPSGAKAEVRAFRKVRVDFQSCTDPFGYRPFDGSFAADPMRAAFIDRLLVTNWKDVPVAPPEALKRSDWFASNIKSDQNARAAILVHQSALCLARIDWAATYQLVDPKSSVDRKGNALEQIVSILPGCIPRGATFRIDRSRLEPIMDELVYRVTIGNTNA